jgi:hypothetical protein
MAERAAVRKPNVIDVRTLAWRLDAFDYRPTWRSEIPERRPNTLSNQSTTPMTTTAFRVLLIFESIGM